LREAAGAGLRRLRVATLRRAAFDAWVNAAGRGGEDEAALRAGLRGRDQPAWRGRRGLAAGSQRALLVRVGREVQEVLRAGGADVRTLQGPMISWSEACAA
jgi:hypothetical protein